MDLNASTPTLRATTQSVTDNSTLIATDQFVRNALLANQMGRLTAVGHSWNNSSLVTGIPPDSQGRLTLIGRLAGLLGIHEDNINNLTIGGSFLTQPVNYNGLANFSGWSGVFALSPPETAAVSAGHNFTNPTQGTVANGPATIVHGINDMNDDPNSWPTLGLNAWTNALTATISFLRACQLYGASSPTGTVVWDSSIVFTNGGAGTHWASVGGVGVSTGPFVQASNSNGDFVTITLPTNWLGGTVGVCFLSGHTGYTTVGGGGINNSATSLTVASAAQFALGSAYVVKIDNEELLVTAGFNTTTWTVTRGVNGTSAAAHSAGAAVYSAPDVGKMTITGTAANATGTFQVNGQGYAGSVCPVVARIVTTAADAGKTIICTVGGLVSGDTTSVIFDGWWVESLTPPPIAVANMPRGIYDGGNQTPTNCATLNGVTNTVVALFDSAVQIADLDTPVYARSAVLSNSINNSTTSIPITANGAAYPTGTGYSITVYAPGDASWEDMLVTGVSGVYPNLTLTVTRGYNASSAVAHASGAFVEDREWWESDNLHPNNVGSSVFAQAVYNALTTAMAQQAAVQPSYQAAVMAGSFVEKNNAPSLPLVDNFYITPPLSDQGTAAIPANFLWLQPIYIPQTCIVTEMGVQATSTAGAAIRFGIYVGIFDGRPSTLITDFGTVSSAAGGTTNFGITNLYQVLKPGWYWLGVALQGSAGSQSMWGGTGVVRTMASSVASATSLLYSAFTYASVSGAFPTALTAATLAAQTDVIGAYLRLRSKQYSS